MEIKFPFRGDYLMSCHSTGHKSIFSNFLIIFFALIFFASFAFAAHTSTVNLEPEWSSADTEIDYDVTFCKTTGDTVNEVRIYKNYDGSINYTGFVCDDLLGWEKLYIGTYPACFYVADDSSPDYNPLDVDGECQTFSFTAHTPVASSWTTSSL